MQHPNDPNNHQKPPQNSTAGAHTAPTGMAGPIVISPTAGRVVWYTPTNIDIATGLTADPANQPLAATVCWVWSDRMVNLSVINTNGVHFPKTSVQLLQEGDRSRSAAVTAGGCLIRPDRRRSTLNHERVRAPVFLGRGQ